jgi:phage baseplate assembly protein W
MADYGTDIACYPDLDGFGSLATGRTAVAQALARRLTTPRGSLFYDTNYGTDLRLYLSESFTQEAQSRVKAAVEAECSKDDRVSSCTANVTFNAVARTLKLSITIDLGDGPFAMTVAVTSLTLALLSVT